MSELNLEICHLFTFKQWRLSTQPLEEGIDGAGHPNETSVI